MTVIAWNKSGMASDSLCSMPDGSYLTKTKKLFRTKTGGVIGTAGDDDCRSVLALFDNCEISTDLPSREEMKYTKTSFNGLLWLPDKSIFVIFIELDSSMNHPDAWYGGVSELSEKYAAVGHGAPYAQAILSHGGTPEEAVREACKWSLFCRGPVQSMVLEEQPKKKIKDRPIVQLEPFEVQINE